MTHNFSLFFYNTEGENKVFETQSKSLEDAMIELYESHPDAIFQFHEVEYNPALFEPETDTINSAIESRKNR